MKQTLEKLSILLLLALLVTLGLSAQAEDNPTLRIYHSEYGTVTVSVEGVVQQPESYGSLSIPTGTLVQITVRPLGRYAIRESFVEWYDTAQEEYSSIQPDSGSNETCCVFSFHMPDTGVECYADFHSPDALRLHGLPHWSAWDSEAEDYLPVLHVKAYVEDIAAPVNEAHAGDTVTLRVTKADYVNYILSAYWWHASNGNVIDIREDVPLTPVPGVEGEYTFVMPDHNVSFDNSEAWVDGAHSVGNDVNLPDALTPLFKGLPVQSADPGTEIMLHHYNYQIDDFEVTDATGENVEIRWKNDHQYFTMPDSPVIISGTALPVISRLIMYFSEIGTSVFTVDGEEVNAAMPGSEVTIEMRPGPGHVVSSIRVYPKDRYDLPSVELTDAGMHDGAPHYRFIMPEYPVWVEYTFDNGHTVTFDSNGGSAVAPQEVKIGETATRPEIPIHGDWAFDGWYQRLESGELARTRFDFTTPIEEDITLVAGWVNGRKLHLPQHVENGTISIFVDNTKVQPNDSVWIAPGEEVRVTMEAHMGCEITFAEIWHFPDLAPEAGYTDTFRAYSFVMPDDDLFVNVAFENPRLLHLMYLPDNRIWNPQTEQDEIVFRVRAFREGVEGEVFNAEAGDTVVLLVEKGDGINYSLVACTEEYTDNDGPIHTPITLTAVEGQPDTYTFTMPNKPVTFIYTECWTTGTYVIYNKLESQRALFPQQNRVPARYANEGDVVELIRTADYYVADITVTGTNGEAVEVLFDGDDGLVSFTMPAFDVIIDGTVMPTIFTHEKNRPEGTISCTVNGQEVNAALPGSLVTLSYTPVQGNAASIPRVECNINGLERVPVTRAGTENGITTYTFTMPNSPVVVESRFGQPIEVIFDTDGGSAVASQLSCWNGFIEEPAPPTRQGFAFVNWYRVLDGGVLHNQPFDFNANTAFTTGDSTQCILKAVWANPCTLTLPTNLFGGSVTASVDARPAAGGVVNAYEGAKVYVYFTPEQRFDLADCVIWQADGSDVAVGRWGEQGGARFCVFMMPGQDVTVQAAFQRVWTGADFTLPPALTRVDEEAFEGIAATAVLVPARCESIGARAFANCESLEAIRIENANCAIDQSAFAGCGTVYIFAPENSRAQAFAEAMDNCEFVAID